MPVKTHRNYQASVLHVNAENLNTSSASIIRLEFDSPEEVIGCLVRAHLETGKKLTRRELNLMLIARRELTSELHQKRLYNDALLMLTTSASS